MTQSLLGYYLNHKNDIVSVTSPDGCFGDKSQGSRMAAKIVPLRFRHVGSQWLVLSQLYQIPSFLKAIFDDGVVGLTDSDATFESSHYKGVFYSVLIHTMVNEPEMNRTGLLLYRLKQDDAWMPVCVDYDSQSFMVECKGVGSADGDF